MEIRYYGDKLSQRIAKTPEGFLICQDVPISRTGYQEYLAKELMDDPINGDKIIPVYRPAKEVFDIRSLASFEGKPVTNEHPDEDVTPENYQQYSCGHVQNVHVGDGEDSNKVLADLYITDPTLIHLIENGKREVSCGYYAEEKKDSDGRLYQTKIRGNHVAVVRSGRAGKRVCIRDSKNQRVANHTATLSDYIEGLEYINDSNGLNKVPYSFNHNKYGDRSMKYYDEDDFMYDDDEEILEDDDEILEDDDELMYDDDKEILEDDDELLIQDEGKKGMKKGQHVMARNPDYLKSLKGAASTVSGAARSAASRVGNALSGAKKSAVGKLRSTATGKKALKTVGSGLGKAIGAKRSASKSIGNFVKAHPTAFKRGKLGAGLAAAGALGAGLGSFMSRKNRGDSWYYDDDEILEQDLMVDDDELMYDDDEILEDGCRYEDDEDLMYDDDEILEDDDELVVTDADEVISQANDLVSDARYTLNRIKRNLRKINRVYDSEIVSDENEEILEDDDEEILEDDDLDIVEDDDLELMEDDDEILEDDDLDIVEDDDEILEDDDDELMEDDDEEILEDDDEELMEDDDEVILEDDDEEILEDDDLDIVEDDDEEILEDDDEEVLTDDDEELMEDDDVEITEADEIKDVNPEAEVIDTDKSAALRQITEASRGISDPNERKQLQDAIYNALCGRNQMADVMRITKKARKSRMDAAANNKGKVDLNQQQSIYDSFNPHKKTSF